MGGGLSKNSPSSPAGGDVPLESSEVEKARSCSSSLTPPDASSSPSSSSSSPVRPASLSPSKSPSPHRPEMAAIKIPEISKELTVPCDPRSPTNEMSRTPLLDAAPFVDPRSPDNTILRTPLDKTSGFKGFALDDSLPYIDESQESAKPSSSPPRLSLSPLNLEMSNEEELEAEEKAGGDVIDSSQELSPRTPREDAVKEFDAAIGEELEKEGALNAAPEIDATPVTSGDAALPVTSGDASASTASGDAAAASFSILSFDPNIPSSLFSQQQQQHHQQQHGQHQSQPQQLQQQPFDHRQRHFSFYSHL